MSGHCPCPGCAASLNPWPPLCRNHWFALPPALRDRIRHLAPKNTFAPFSDQYRAALAEGVAWLEEAACARAATAGANAALAARITGERE